MRLLVDANLSPVVRAELRSAGYDATHVYDHGLGTASDEAIPNLTTIEEELKAGSVVSISPTHLRACTRLVPKVQDISPSRATADLRTKTSRKGCEVD